MIYEQTIQGSFRGVEFNYENSERTSGRKSIFHTFPNSDIVETEDLGLSPKAFNLSMIVSGIGNEYFSKRNSLQKALDTFGPAELVHPLYGLMTVQTSGNYTTSETIGEQGKAVISANFIRVDEGEAFAGATPRTIEKDKENIVEAAKEEAETSIVQDFLEGVKAVKENITKIKSTFTTVSRLITDPSLLSNYSAVLREFGLKDLNNIADIIDGVDDLFSFGRDAVDDVDLWLDGIKETYSYGDDSDTSTPTTLAKVEEQNNNLAFRNLMQTLSAAYGASAMIDVTYTTDVSLNSETESIMDQLDKAAELNSLNDDIYSLLKEAKTNLREAIDAESLNVFKVKTITVRTTSLTTLVHSLYGNLDNYDIVNDLNDFNDPSFVEGEVKVVTLG